MKQRHLWFRKGGYQVGFVFRLITAFLLQQNAFYECLLSLCIAFWVNPSIVSESQRRKSKRKTARLGGSLFCCNVTEGKLNSKIHKHLFTIHYYLLPEILNASIVKSEKWKSKNPERYRIQDFLAPPVGLDRATSVIPQRRLSSRFCF